MSTEATTGVTFDPEAAGDFLRVVFSGLPGRIQVCATDQWTGVRFPTDETGIAGAVVHARLYDGAGPAGVYFRATTVLDDLPAHRRGGAADTVAVPLLWADVDYGTEGHKGTTLPPTQDDAERLIAESGMPEPTILVHSGGGLYPLWRLRELPDPAEAARLSERVQAALLRVSQAHGWTYGTGVADLARVLRLPGSVNRKTANPRPCRVIGGSGEPIDAAEVPEAPSPTPAPSPPRRHDPDRGAGPLDVLAGHLRWADLLAPAGWTYVTTERDGAELWLRPGEASSEYSARCFEHNMVVHSEATDLPSGAGNRLTKGRVFAHLHYGGDVAEAARDLVRAAHGSDAAPAARDLPESALAAVRTAHDARDRQAWARLGVNVDDYRPAPPGPDGDAAGPRSRPWTPAEAIGPEPFDPGANSDHVIAEAAVVRLYPILRFNSDTSSWLVRHAEQWRDRRDSSAVREWALAQLLPLMPHGDPAVPRKKEDYSVENWKAARRARFASSAGTAAIGNRLRAMVTDHHPLCVRADDLDAEPGVLWAGGTPWDLRRSGEVPTPAALDPATPHLATASVVPDPTVPTPFWDAYVASVLPDQQLRTWALRVLSVGLTGHADAVLPILWGPERTGKTSLVTLLMRLLGTYSRPAPASLLGPEPPQSVIADVHGRRLVFVDEGPRRGHLATERLKQLTGGGLHTGARKYRDEFEFTPTHTLVMTTNDEPALTDPALRARMRLIPCNSDPARVRAARQALTERVWAAEAPGVLAALMRAAAQYLADPDSVGKDRAGPAAAGADGRTEDQIAADQDPVGQWVADRMVRTTPAAGTAATLLLGQYAAWVERQPHLRRGGKAPDPLSPTAFGRRLGELGVAKDRIGGRQMWGLAERPIAAWSGPTA